MSQRLIQSGELPATLWNGTEEHLCLPPRLVAVYADVLRSAGLYDKALGNEHHEGPVGGISQEETDAHFAKAFSGSCARVQLAILDPHNKMPVVADSFAKLLSGGRVAIADIPSGAGAAVLAVLHNIAELRRASVVPREPLEVIILGGEISEAARRYAEALLTQSAASLGEQAITVDAMWKSWDACDELSTVDLIQELNFRARDCAARYLLVANFSGYLQRGGKWKNAEPQLKQIFQHFGSKHACGIWIEPQTNEAVHPSSGMLAKLTGWFTSKWNRFVKVLFSEQQHTSSARYELPLRPGATARVNLAVLRFDLTRS